MELIATVVGYLMIAAFCVLLITTGAYYTVQRVIDAYGIRDEFLRMKRERDDAWEMRDRALSELARYRMKAVCKQ